MLTLTWLAGLVSRRPARLIATAVGVAVAVALVASIGTFVSATTSTMTRRASGRVAVDWQVQAQTASAIDQVLAETRRTPGVRSALVVSFASTPGLVARTGGTVQHTGAGRVLGIPPGYATAFPGEMRLLAGSLGGPLLAQQTAANLHAGPGDTITIERAGAPAAPVRIAGVVDLPAADSLFQKVGAPTGAQPQATPDNIVILPTRTFHQVMDVGGAATVVTQVHARLSHDLPASPSAAFTEISGRALNLETRLAGAGVVGDNLGFALDKARADALYAQILFLFLGLPGVVLAGILTAWIAGTGNARRRRDQALIRARGASRRDILWLAAAETALAGVAGIAIGLLGAAAIGSATFGTASFGAGPVSAVLWAVGASLAGVLVAAAAITLPAWRDSRTLSVADQRRDVRRVSGQPWWARFGVDIAALVAAGLVFWQASQDGYHLVLAPEGLPQVSVNWLSLLAPVLAWVGGGLLVYRLSDLALGHGRGFVTRLIRPFSGGLAPTVAATMGRQRRLLAGAVTLVALTAAFAGSTAVFNSTYQQQAEVDARLSNGADVTVTQSPGAPVGPSQAGRLASVPGVASVEPIQHRFAYVGPDLQDLYGVRPGTIGAAGALQNAWFSGGTASGLMATLNRRPDSILVSAETVKDFQLNPGDLLRLRLQDGLTKKYRTIPFHYAGIVKEFPTAPTDSFLVANSSYVAKMTGSDAVGAFLVQTDGAGPATVAQRIRTLVGTGAAVTDIASQRRVIGTNLTAVSLSGLTRVELGFALLLAATATGLALALGFRERRRSFAITRALGASPRQLGAFVWSESAFVTAGGIALGAALATGLSWLLVTVLTGVFDPPPDAAAIPWGYLSGVTALALASVVAAGGATLAGLRRGSPEALRDL